MKIIHTSDWHIGQLFYRFNRDDEHRHFFQQLVCVAKEEQADAMVVCGDVFHNPAPSAAAKQLFVEGVLDIHYAAPQMPIIITAGNHDSGTRLEAEQQLWNLANIHVVGCCKREDDGTFNPSQFIFDIDDKGIVVAVPYFHATSYPLATIGTEREIRQKAFFEKLLQEVENAGKPIVLMAHLAVEGCDTHGHEDDTIGGMQKEQLTDLGTGYDYLALGHIHKPQMISPHAYYSGSSIPVSFSEDYPHSVNVVEIKNHGDIPKVRTVRLKPLREVKTIPANGAPLAAALDALQALPDADNSYIRLLIDQDEPLQADAEDRANLIASDKSCRFCDVMKKQRQKENSCADKIEVNSVADLKTYSPLDIALQSYERNYGLPMNEDLIALMQQAIEETRNALKQ